ncbi:hypothetical protein CLV59_110161 [Chitinophaga dinghuensis]|uniref:Uncharacterized protein n=1 Tax=Chitinophaga dinghuensis TaxID=1539050 RepID=A0A327VK71_9BACT|nr:hypothetical protein [Chitinophaga dinghuensis]RAJ75114.1 hypothetical protein CLV59_110161 [Chitinophaga dinghuensis]
MQFFNEENVPIPLPPADSSWKLMEQALNKAMPVNAPAGGSESPHAGSLGVKLLTIAKYIAVTVFCAGVIAYGVYRMTAARKKVAPAEDHSTMTRDSALKVTDSGSLKTKNAEQSRGMSQMETVTTSGEGVVAGDVVNNGMSGAVSSNASVGSTVSGGVASNGLSTSGNISANKNSHGAVAGGNAGSRESGSNIGRTVSGGVTSNGLSTSGNISANKNSHGVVAGGNAGSRESGSNIGRTVSGGVTSNGLSTSGNISANKNSHGAVAGGNARSGESISGNVSSKGSSGNTIPGSIANNGLSTSGKVPSNAHSKRPKSVAPVGSRLSTSGDMPSNGSGRGIVTAGGADNRLSNAGGKRASTTVANNGASSSENITINRNTVVNKNGLSNHPKLTSEKNISTGKSLKLVDGQASQGNPGKKYIGKHLPNQTTTTNGLSGNDKENQATSENATTNTKEESASHISSLVKPGIVTANNRKKNIAAAQRKGNNGKSQPSPINTAVSAAANSPLPASSSETGTPAITAPLYAGIQFQPIRTVRNHSSSPLQVSAETMGRITNYRMPKNTFHTPGYWEIMGQWSIPIPITNNPGYYKGPSGNTQFYRLLIPGFRAQRTWNNAAISLDLNLMATQIYDKQPYSRIPSGTSSIDEQSLTLLQTFGYKAGLAYHHRLVGQFFGSAGIQAYLGHTGSIQETSATRDTFGIHNKTIIYMNKGSLWNSLGKFQGNITAELYYDHKRWQAAARTAIPVLHTAKDSIGTNMKPAIQLEILLRWKIWKNK